ncbi:RHS repeat-associated protein [Paenarthrobacter nicotinovorans]|uniref:RHS repeat-associated protein n=1 Tax=Paenarthrobacter nicotinovorans TaxID=29320 RepID=A0ABT9TS25_PAENI|nr:RHS repeat-associated core domain-containing protein [Paenarthrobacter nicotinovorans]MDQ0104478.1 RHS repeat-associated protein [Paenarthrobacter nicotinovorans]
MKIFSSLTLSKTRATITGVVSAAVIASGAGFVYVTAPWESPDHVNTVKPVPVKEWTPGSDTAGEHQIVDNPEANGTGKTIQGTGTGVAPTVDPSLFPADVSRAGGQAGTRSVPVKAIALAPAAVPQAPVAGNNDKGSGDFTALPGASSGSWGVTGQTGSFTWNYPFSLREAPAGATPALGIAYDSSRVDGLTSSTNNQTSPVGDGWALTGGGQIQQKFGSCMDQGVANSYDLCGNPGGQQFTISFGSRSGAIIRDATTGVYKLQNDDNTKVEYLPGAANGTFDGGYWRLTDTSGTQYWFGVNRIPGWSAGKDNYSTDIVPVYGLPGQPCYKSTGFGDSVCMQAYAWNLDYVVDLNGNSQGFFYTQDTNFYKSQAGTGPLRAYHRASRLARVDYGMRAGTELSTQAPIHVNFGYTGRCQGVTGCPTPNGDVPAEFLCASSGTCNTYSPTFFTFYRLQTVISQSLSVNPAGYGNTDFWTFFHAMPDPGDGTKPALWLGSLIHQGSNETSSTGGWITDPAVEFSGQTLHNRVWAVDGLAPFDRYRLSTIKTATGASIQVSYKAAECSQTNLPAAAETNTKRCFPQRWTPTAPIAQNPRLDHFNIYPVEKVVSKAGPGSAGTVDMVTSYTYVGTPAWKYAAPKYVSGTAGQNITWSSLAGWSQVKTTTGTAASNPTTVTTYLRGLNGTPSNTTGGLRADSVTLSDNTVVPDSVWRAGMEVEKQNYAGDGGALLGTTITLPWESAPTATGTAATGAAEARHIGIASVTRKTSTSKSTGMRVSQTSLAYDTYGRTIRTSTTGEIGVLDDESCIVTAYADNPALNILSYPASVDSFAGECTGTGPNGNLLKASRTLYDSSTSAVPGSTGYTAPTKGNTARSDKATAVTGTTVSTWGQGPTLTVDALGRVIKSSDTSTGTARNTTTTYAPASGLATTVTETNPLGWVSTTTLDSMRGQPLTKTDANGKVTSYRYDNAGRVTGQWDPMRPAATNATPTVETSYSISQTNPSWVKTVTIAGNGVPVSSYTIYDGLGRERQTQSQSPTGGKILTDTWYDSRGEKSTVNNKYFTSGAPDGVLVIPQLAVPSSTQYEYDAAGRPTKVRAMTGDTQELWATKTSYTGMDTTTVTGPGSEAAVTTIVNLAGKTEQRSLFHGTAPTGAADVSSYVYDRFGQMMRMGDGANLWTWTYDAAGREIAAVDPDSGARSTLYDASGRVASATDAFGTVTGYVYDTLDRTTAKTVTVSGGTTKTLETHTYDQELKGLASSSTRNNGAAYDQPVTTTFSGYNNLYQASTTTLTLPAGLTGFAGSYTTTRSYSTSGKVRTAVSPAIGGLPAEEVRYGYDEFENPSSTWNTTGDQFGGNAQYDNLGFLTTFLQYDAKAGDGSSTSNTTGTNNVYFGWDAATGRLNGQWTTNNTRGTISDLGKTTYTYNEAGKLAARELTFSSRPGVASDYQCYDYDYASRLQAVWTPASKSCTTAPTTASTTVAGLGGPAAYAQTYAYTAAGDRSQVKRFDATGALAVTEQYNYSAPGTAGPHQVQSVVSTPGPGGAATTQTFTWDAAGRMTGRAGQTLTYTADGRLATTTGTSTVPANPNPGAANGTPAGPTTGAGSLGTRYYDASGSLVGIVDGSGTTVTLGPVTAHSTPSGVKTATCTYEFAGKIVAQRTAAAGAAKLSFIVGDGVNTAQTMTQPTTGAGPISAIQRYTDPYGLARGANLTGTGNNTYTAAGAGTAGVGSNAANPNGFSAANGFIAGLDDTVSSLTHLGARELDVATGAFTTPDPVIHTDKADGFTAYAYAAGDPVNRTDPSGLDWWNNWNDFTKGVSNVFKAVKAVATNFVRENAGAAIGAAVSWAGMWAAIPRAGLCGLLGYLAGACAGAYTAVASTAVSGARQAATDFTNAAVGSRKATQPGKALTNWALGRPQEKLTPAVFDGRGEYVTAIQNRQETRDARSQAMSQLSQGQSQIKADKYYDAGKPGLDNPNFLKDVCNYSHWLEGCGYQEHPRAISALGSYNLSVTAENQDTRNRTATLVFTATNDITLGSAFGPTTATREWLNGLPGQEGPFSAVRQEFIWREEVSW